MIELKLRGPKPLYDREGHVVVRFGEQLKCSELDHAFTVSVVGWGTQLLATGDSIEELADLVLKKYKRVRISSDSEFKPFDNGSPVW
jgi:hypothetical protein